MKTATVREFKTHTSRYFSGKEDVMVTRHGKAVALVTPIEPKSPAATLAELRVMLKEAGISKKDLLSMLEEVRREVYR